MRQKNKRRLPGRYLLAAAVLLFGAGCNSPSSDDIAEDLRNASTGGSQTMHTLKIDTVLHGSISTEPELVHGEEYPEGLEITVTARANEGYVLDSLYRSGPPHPWGPAYIESMQPEMSFVLEEDTSIGAAFLPAVELEGIRVVQDIVYAKPGVKELKYDVFSPENAANLPLIVIVHGGGWSSNDENIMRGMAREIARTGRYVAASIDYRWIGHGDGDVNPNGMEGLIADVFGAVLHVREHASRYGADPDRIAITGDSAGGHLAASAATMIERLGDAGFGNGSYEYLPTYLPEGMSVQEARALLAASVKVAAPSYGVFGGQHLARFADSESALTAISPTDNIPAAASRAIPHYLIRGTSDSLITEEMVSSYAAALREAGQEVHYVEVEGAGHAFFDWKPDSRTRRTFQQFGLPYIADMLEFIDRHI